MEDRRQEGQGPPGRGDLCARPQDWADAGCGAPGCPVTSQQGGPAMRRRRWGWRPVEKDELQAAQVEVKLVQEDWAQQVVSGLTRGRRSCLRKHA